MKTEPVTYAVPEGRVEDIELEKHGWSIKLDAGNRESFDGGIGTTAQNEAGLRFNNKLYDYSGFDWQNNEWLLMKEGASHAFKEVPQGGAERWKNVLVIFSEIDTNSDRPFLPHEVTEAVRDTIVRALSEL